MDLSIGALSIQQKSPVQIFGIFAGRMERVRPLPRIRGDVLCNTLCNCYSQAVGRINLIKVIREVVLT